MIEAQKKRKENIAEYILYLFQIEDLIRAYQFDPAIIDKQLVAQYQVDENKRLEISEWYKNLCFMMEKEGIREKGHFQFLSNQINELNEIHLKLMETGINKEYTGVFKSVSGLISELNLKGNSVKNDLQISFDAIYGYLLLKMQQKQVTAETTEAIKRLSYWLGLLSKLFKEYEEGTIDFEQTK